VTTFFMVICVTGHVAAADVVVVEHPVETEIPARVEDQGDFRPPSIC